MNIDWLIEVKTDDGYTIFESDAVVEYSVSNQYGEDIVEVDGFEIEASHSRPVNPSALHQTEWEVRTQPAHFDANSKQAWAKLLFFHVKEVLEADQEFIDAVLEQEESFNDRPRRSDPYRSQRLLACELI